MGPGEGRGEGEDGACGCPAGKGVADRAHMQELWAARAGYETLQLKAEHNRHSSMEHKHGCCCLA